MGLRVGDRVRILKEDIEPLKDKISKGQDIIGYVSKVLGGDVYLVRPAWCIWDMELNANELYKM